MTQFVLPDLGEGLHEAEIVMWHVGPGDHVVADQPMVSVETDKAVVEIPSPRSGHISRLLAQPGDLVEVGEAIVEFADGAAADAGAIVGTLRTAAAEPERHDLPAPPSGRRATPAVRRRASELGVDLASVTPTGPDGTITSADVEAVATAVARASSGIEPLRGVRRAMDANMSRAHAEVVPATVTDEADIGDWDQHEDVTLRLVRAVARACIVEPALNVSFLGRDVGRRHNEVIDLGVAVDTADGLFVPVLRDVAHRSADDLRDGLEALKRDVAARTVPAEELKGQTITLSNFGVFAGRHAALVVVPPQVAIVGAGRVRSAVVAHQGQPAVRRVLPVSLTFDHRVVMGSEAARFLGALVTDLEGSS